MGSFVTSYWGKYNFSVAKKSSGYVQRRVEGDPNTLEKLILHKNVSYDRRFVKKSTINVPFCGVHRGKLSILSGC